jgi:DNA-directed RNA polymerase specialized sigma24 family protein
MDYSKFVGAVLDNDTEELNAQVRVITSVLIKFLTVRLDATLEDAQDCAQTTLMHVTEKIRENKLDNPDRVIYYMFTSAKNEYLKSVAKIKEATFDEVPDTHMHHGDQLNRLLNEERMAILKACLDALKPDFRSYIKYWFDNPADETAVVADHFGISVSNAWTKKHRVLKLLKECVEKKLKF